MSCVPPHALVSGLALRIEREGYLPTPADLRALLGLGFTRDDLRAAFLARRATRADDAFARAVGVLDSLPDRA
jgi:hypothetical protein